MALRWFNSITGTTASSLLSSSSTSGNSAQDALKALVKLLQSGHSNSSGTSGPTDPLAALFSQIDTNGEGTITKQDLENAVTKAGGTKQAADALWAKLDPNNTDRLTEQQFAENLPKPRQPDNASANNGQNIDSISVTITISNGGQQDQGSTKSGNGALNIFG